MQPPRRALTAMLALVLAAGIAACGDDDDDQGGDGAATQEETTATAPAGDGPASAEEIAEQISDNPDERPRIPTPAGDPPAELQPATVIGGDGEEAEAGDAVTVQYAGASWATGQEFDASYERGEPFEFELGAGMVIPGWDQGVEGMRVGERRVLVIPPDLAYGPEGAPPAIGPDETLVFVVDLVGVG